MKKGSLTVIPFLLMLFTCLLMLWSFTVSAQQFEITGRLNDSLGRPLPNGAVRVSGLSDSSLASFALSDRKGAFRIRDLAQGSYLLEITYLGYRPYLQTVSPPENGRVLDLGTITMEPALQELEGVTVQGQGLPMRIRNDTLEFDAGAFKTKPNAAVEDLLKKLPGVEVDEDGTIRAQGEEVERVTVDGEDFFGRDPKIASRNLPADAVDNVQVYDRKSDKAMFTGVDDGQKEKTINLDLKEDYRKSTFGSVTAGGGTDDRFAGNASINRFNQGQQLSILGMANNTNEQGFSIGDYLDFTGGPQGGRRRGGGFQIVTREAGSGNNAPASPPLNTGQPVSGMMTNWAGGINFKDAFSEQLEVNGNYFAEHLDHETDQSTERINYLPGGDYSFLQHGSQENVHTGHRGSAILDFKPDSSNSFKLNSSFNYNQTHMSADNESQTLGADNEEAARSRQTNLAEGSNLNVNADLLYRHRFGKPGRTLSANMQLGIGDNQREGTLDALNEFQQGGLPPELIRQSNSQSTGNRSIGGGLSYTEPLGAGSLLEFNYELRQQLNEVNRDVWDIGEDETRSYNEMLSSDYESDYRYQRGGMNFQLNAGAVHLTAGMNYQQSRLDGELFLSDTLISRDFQSFLPSVQFRYDFPGNKHLEFDYRTRLREPSIEELQPVTDNSDPLNIYRGNPELRPAYVQQARLNFMTFNPASMIHFFAFLNANYITDAISYSQTVDEQLIRTTQPVNAGEQVELRGSANFGFPLSKINSRLSVSADVNTTSGVNLLNGEEERIRQREVGGELRYDYHLGETLNVSLSGNLSRQQNKFGSGTEQLFTNQRYQSGVNLAFLEHYGLQLNFGYSIYNSESGDFNQEIPLLDIALSRYVFKNKQGEIRLSVDNLLDKDLGVSQQAGVNYIERSVTESLGRYALLSFTYAINKQLNPVRNRGGNIRIKR